MKNKTTKTMLVAVIAVFLVNCVCFAQLTFRKVYGRALDNYIAGNYIQAREAFTNALELAATADEKAKSRLGVGSSYAGEKQFESARKEFIEVIQMKPKAFIRDSARLEIAQSYAAEKKFDRARQELSALIKEEGVDSNIKATARFDMAQTYLDEKKFDEARTLYAQMIEGAKPNDPMTLVVRISIANSYLAERKMEQARKAYQELLQTGGILKPRAQFNIGQTFVVEKNYAQAKIEFEKLLQIQEAPFEVKEQAKDQLQRLAELQTLQSQLRAPSVSPDQLAALREEEKQILTKLEE